MTKNKLPAIAEIDFQKFAAKFKWPTEKSFAVWVSEAQRSDAKFGASGAPVDRVQIGFDEAVAYCERTGAIASYTALWRLVQEKASAGV